MIKILLHTFPLFFLSMSLQFTTIASAKKTKTSKISQSQHSITGVIEFTVKAPKRKRVDNTSDSYCAKTALLSDSVIVNNGRLQDVHVRIKSGTMGTHAAPKTPILVRQEGCLYHPHMVGAMVGQPVAIANKDKTMHNVHAKIKGDSWFNRSQPMNAPKIVETDTGKAGEVFELVCNVHPWMHSFMPITDHPYFDVSDNKGKFKIKNVPTGEFTLEAWHPKYGVKSIQVTVKKKTTKVSFQFP